MLVKSSYSESFFFVSSVPVYHRLPSFSLPLADLPRVHLCADGPELYPTSVRSTGLGVGNSFAR